MHLESESTPAPRYGPVNAIEQNKNYVSELPDNTFRRGLYSKFVLKNVGLSYCGRGLTRNLAYTRLPTIFDARQLVTMPIQTTFARIRIKLEYSSGDI
jgi:hypothetical protein